MEVKNSSTTPIIFSGNIALHYDEYQGPVYFEPYALEIANRIKSLAVGSALELACGTGRVTRHIRAAIPPSARFTASDISPDMMSVAKEKLEAYEIDWKIIDAQKLPFEDSSFDLVVCCFGYMFVPDIGKAFAEVYRVLQPGGSFLFTTWDKLELNGSSFVYRKIVRDYLGESIPEAFHLAFSMNDDDVITEHLHQAGFSKIKIEKVSKVATSSSAREVAYGLVQGGIIYNELMKRNPSWIDEIRTKAEYDLAEKFGPAPMMAPMSAVLVDARK